MAFVYHRFTLNKEVEQYLRTLPNPFANNSFGELVFYRTYSRLKDDGKSQEDWIDVVIRVMNGTMSIRKDWYLKNHIEWNESYWQHYARSMAISMFQMQWLPPGRGLWAQGTNFIYEEGSMALYNCALANITSTHIAEGIKWIMDCLMLGVGVGFNPIRDELEAYIPNGHYDFIIPDSREGWIESVERLIIAFIKPNQKEPRYDYTHIRPAGSLIKRFGGICNGYEDLENLHDSMRYFFIRYVKDPNYDIVMLKTDIINSVGVCTCSGNVRRSAELCGGKITDQTFLNLKDYNKYPYRINHGYMSNNSAQLYDDQDFDLLGEIAQRVIHNGEPGCQNLRNFPEGRIGKKGVGREREKDIADGTNPCGEIVLEGGIGFGGEVCNLSDTLPTKCVDINDWLKACEYAATYCQTVSLLPTHQPETNKIIARNRRIGVGLMDFIGWKHQIGTHQVIKYLRKGYKLIRKKVKQLAEESGVPEPIRICTLKPNGTTAKIAGARSGAGYSNFEYMIRRIRVPQYSAFYNILCEANIPHESDLFSPHTEVFEFPWSLKDGTKTAEEVTLWEQAMNLILLQREWSDNAVSNTLMFKPKWVLRKEIYGNIECRNYINNLEEVGIEINLEAQPKLIEMEHMKLEIKYAEELIIKEYQFNPHHEENDVEPVLSAIIPLIKTCSLLPITNNFYRQMPEEGVSRTEYERRLAEIKPIDWSLFLNNANIEEKEYCGTEKCELPIGRGNTNE